MKQPSIQRNLQHVLTPLKFLNQAIHPFNEFVVSVPLAHMLLFLSVNDVVLKCAEVVLAKFKFVMWYSFASNIKEKNFFFFYITSVGLKEFIAYLARNVS